MVDQNDVDMTVEKHVVRVVLSLNVIGGGLSGVVRLMFGINNPTNRGRWEVINDPVVLVALMDAHLEFVSAHLGQRHIPIGLGAVHPVHHGNHIR